MATNINSGSIYNGRLLQDGYYVSTTAVSASGFVGGTFNLVQAVPYPTTEEITLNLLTSNLSASNNTTAAFWFQDSIDGVNWSNISQFASITSNITATGGNGPVSASVLLPPNVEQYVRVSCSVSTGTITASIQSYINF